jgi:hypothetical protein
MRSDSQPKEGAPTPQPAIMVDVSVAADVRGSS